MSHQTLKDDSDQLKSAQGGKLKLITVAAALVAVVEPIRPQAPPLYPVEVEHGTLVVALATPKVIVVASDSRRSGEKSYTDDSKKLFKIQGGWILGIAGLSDCMFPGFPTLTTGIARNLDTSIELSRKTFGEEPNPFFKQNWDEPPNPAPEAVVKNPEALANWMEFERYRRNQGALGMDISEWRDLLGPLQTIYNVLLAYGDSFANDPRYQLLGVVAGFQSDGTAKLNRLSLSPMITRTNEGLPVAMVAQGGQPSITRNGLIWKTLGINGIAELVLSRNVSPETRDLLRGFPTVSRYLSSSASFEEGDLVSLAEELIRVTARASTIVGADPLQIAVLHPGKPVILRQPTFSTAESPITHAGENHGWRLSERIPQDFSFDQGGKTWMTYTNCVIHDMKNVIPLDNADFFGNDFDNVTFVYHGGPITFDKNKLSRSTLIIDHGVDESHLSSILPQFTFVKR